MATGTVWHRKGWSTRFHKFTGNNTFEEEETFPSTSIERCVRHGIVLPSSAHENVDVGNTLGGGNRYHHHHQHTHTSSKDGENPSPFSSTHKTYLVRSELPHVQYNRNSEYNEISTQLEAMEGTIENVHERSKRRNNEKGVMGDVRTTYELRRQIGTSLESQLEIFYKLMQNNKYEKRPPLPLYFGYLPSSLKPL